MNNLWMIHGPLKSGRPMSLLIMSIPDPRVTRMSMQSVPWIMTYKESTGHWVNSSVFGIWSLRIPVGGRPIDGTKNLLFLLFCVSVFSNHKTIHSKVEGKLLIYYSSSHTKLYSSQYGLRLNNERKSEKVNNVYDDIQLYLEVVVVMRIFES